MSKATLLLSLVNGATAVTIQNAEGWPAWPNPWAAQAPAKPAQAQAKPAPTTVWGQQAKAKPAAAMFWMQQTAAPAAPAANLIGQAQAAQAAKLIGRSQFTSAKQQVKPSEQAAEALNVLNDPAAALRAAGVDIDALAKPAAAQDFSLPKRFGRPGEVLNVEQVKVKHHAPIAEQVDETHVPTPTVTGVCACLPWSQVYKKVNCGSGYEDKQLCGTNFYQELPGNRCVAKDVASASKSAAWCYISTECEQDNKFGELTEGTPVAEDERFSYKICGNDTFESYADVPPQVLLKLTGVNTPMLVAHSYVFSATPWESVMHYFDPDVIGYLPQSIDGKRVLVESGDNQWSVDNSQYMSTNSGGVSFRSTTDMNNILPMFDAIARWGTTITGTDTGNGWVQAAVPMHKEFFSGIPKEKILELDGIINSHKPVAFCTTPRKSAVSQQEIQSPCGAPYTFMLVQGKHLWWFDGVSKTPKCGKCLLERQMTTLPPIEDGPPPPVTDYVPGTNLLS